MAKRIVLACVLFFGLCSLAFSGTPAQTEKALVNDDVIKLVEVKMSKEVVVSKINQAASVAFDLSTDALVYMKKKGVSDDVLGAMLKRQEAEDKASRMAAVPATAPTEQPAEEGRMSRLKARMMNVVHRDGGDAEAQKSGESLTPTANVKLYLTEAPKEPYKALGRVDAGKYNFAGISRKRESVDAELRDKAAKLGADAIVNITEDFASVAGVAVRFEKR